MSPIWVLLFFLQLVIGLHGNPYGEDIESDLKHVQFRQLCSSGKRQLIQLGTCSGYYIDCGNKLNGEYAVRKCFQGEVFSRGQCVPANSLKQCMDTQLNSINEETKQLAERSQFCFRGSGLYLIAPSKDNHCARQAIVCHSDRRTAIPVACPLNYVINENLECFPAHKKCYGIDFKFSAPIREYFLQRHCAYQRPTPVPVLYHSQQSQYYPKMYTEQQCTTWYIDCSSQPSIIHCEIGQIYDDQLGYCRQWLPNDLCPMKGICVGREWGRYALGNCSSQYVECSGMQAKFYTCDPGLVFVDGQCTRVRECEKCRDGEKRKKNDYGNCEEFEFCKKGSWVTRTCPQGFSFDERARECRQGYKCAIAKKCTFGTSYTLTCDTYMMCDGEKFALMECSALTRWDGQKKQCIPDYEKKCKKDTEAVCREHEIIPSYNCKTYSKCKNGKFHEIDCKKHEACSHCKNTSPTPIDYTWIPSECEKGKRKAHQSDCSAYFVCDGRGQWQYQRCSSDQSFNTKDNKCSSKGDQYCSVGREMQCRHAERLLIPNSCDRILECVNGQWQEMECPKGTIYDQNLKACVSGTCSSPDKENKYPEMVYIPYNQTQNTDSYNKPLPMYNIEEKYQVYGIPEDRNYKSTRQVETYTPAPYCFGQTRIIDRFDCSRFQECSRGVYVSRRCTTGSVFNPKTGNCQPGNKCIDDNYGKRCTNGWFQTGYKCGEYRLCTNGQWIDRVCEGGNSFLNGRCTYKKCQDYQDPFPSRDCITGSVRPNPHRNTVYWVCNFGEWVERVCMQGTVFKAELERCSPLPLPPPSPPLPGPRPPSYPPPSPPIYECQHGEVKRVNGDCTRYQKCVHGSFQFRFCPSGSGFDGYKCTVGYCQYNDMGDKCVESSGPSGYRASHRCDEFYQCAQGKWTRMPCAPGTVFNAQKTVCDHIANVPRCGNNSGGYGGDVDNQEEGQHPVPVNDV